MGNALDVVNKFFDFVYSKKDVQSLNDFINTDGLFESPMDRKMGKEEIVTHYKLFIPSVIDQTMLKQFEHENHVCSIYDMKIEARNGKEISTTIVDWMEIKDNSIFRQKVIYDPRIVIENAT